MASPIRIKRRAGGSPGAPESLLNAELAFNEVDNTLYYGKGTGGGGGTASVILAIGGDGAFVALSGNQTVGGTKTFTSIPKSTGTPSQATDLITKSYLESRLSSTGAGTVMSVDASVPTGFEISGGPITESGILAITYAVGYQGYTTAEYTKLSNIANNATANDTDANLKNRANHTGTQAISTVSGLQTALDAKIPTSEKGVAGGVATLDGTGKVPTSQLPDSVLGGVKYVSSWNASTNDPTIPVADASNQGHYYVVSVAGTTDVDGTTDWEIGDWIISNGTAWEKIDNTDSVTSVNSKMGTVVLDLSDFASTGSMAYQSAGAVAITGGTIDGVTLDGGTF